MEMNNGDLRYLVQLWAHENELQRVKLGLMSTQLDQNQTKLNRHRLWLRIVAAIGTVAIGVGAYFVRADVQARHAGDQRAKVVQHEVDQTFGIAHTFLCEQMPTP